MARRRRADRRLRGAAPRPPVRWTPVIGLSLLLFTGGWTILWFFARAEALSTFEQWRESERSFGRVWTCPGQSIGGYPLAIELTCDGPTFKGPVANGVFDGRLARLTATAQLYFPTKVVVTLTGPLEATEVATKQHVEATWAAGVVTLRGLLPDGLDRGLLEASQLRLADSAQPQDAVTLDRIALGFKPMPRSVDARSDVRASIDADGVRIPLLDASLGTRDPLAIRATALATQVRFDGRATAAEVLGPWMRAGGQVHLQDFDARKGALRITASGRFGLDEEHRLEGRVDAGFTGLGPLADRLGLPVDVLKLGGTLASLLGGSKDASPAGTDVTLPITAKNGTLMMGPVRTGVTLTPLY
jgi:hypothetical protein